MALLNTQQLGDMGRNVRRILRNDWRERRKFALRLILLSVGISLLPFVQSGSLALLINTVTDPLLRADVTRVFAVTALMLAGSFLPEFIYALQGYTQKRHWLAMQIDYETVFHRKKSQIDLAAYEDPKFLNLLQKFEEQWIYPILRLTDAQYVNIQNVIEVVVAAGILVWYDWRLLLLVLVASVPAFIVEMRYGYGFWGIYDAKAEERRRYESYKHHFERITDLIELRLFQSAGFFLRRMRDLTSRFLGEQAKLERKKLAWQMLAVLVATLGVGLAVFLIVRSAITGEILVGTMAFLLYAIRDFRNACSGFLLNVGAQYRDSLFVSDGFAVLDTGPRLPRPATPLELDAHKTPVIEFDRVSFAYPGSAKPVLKDITLRIAPGERLGLVGINGAGKTTLVKLLCRIYDPTEGRILIDGKDLREVDPEQWWSMIAVLFQDYANFKMSAKEVIALGRASEEAPLPERIEQAALQAGASEFIDTWDKKYEQMIGREFDGLELSKGQLQKLSLSRVFYRDPKMMILDEPTASVDAEAERKIFEQLEKASRAMTILLISHRFSTLRNADRICVIIDGSIAELGSHEQLMQRGGEYARLFKMQAEGYSERK